MLDNWWSVSLPEDGRFLVRPTYELETRFYHAPQHHLQITIPFARFTDNGNEL